MTPGYGFTHTWSTTTHDQDNSMPHFLFPLSLTGSAQVKTCCRQHHCHLGYLCSITSKQSFTWPALTMGLGCLFVSGMDNLDARLIQASAGVHPLCRWVWHQTPPLGMTIMFTPWSMVNICPQGRARVCIWDTSPALFWTTFTCLVLVIRHVSSHDVMSWALREYKARSSQLDLIGLRYRLWNTCADGLHGEWAHLACRAPWRSDCWQWLVVDLSNPPTHTGRHLSPREGPGFAFGILTLLFFGTTFTCLVLVIRHVSSHDIMGFDRVQSKVHSGLWCCLQMGWKHVF